MGRVHKCTRKLLQVNSELVSKSSFGATEPVCVSCGNALVGTVLIGFVRAWGPAPAVSVQRAGGF